MSEFWAILASVVVLVCGASLVVYLVHLYLVSQTEPTNPFADPRPQRRRPNYFTPEDEDELTRQLDAERDAWQRQAEAAAWQLMRREQEIKQQQEAERIAIETQIPPLIRELGQRYDITSFDRLKNLMLYVHYLLDYSLVNLDGGFPIRRLWRGVIPLPSMGGYPAGRTFIERLSKSLSAAGVLEGTYRNLGRHPKRINLEAARRQLYYTPRVLRPERLSPNGRLDDRLEFKNSKSLAGLPAEKADKAISLDSHIAPTATRPHSQPATQPASHTASQPHGQAA